MKTFSNRSGVESQKQLGKFDSLPLISTQHHQSVANYKKVTIDTVTPDHIKTLSKKLQESRRRGKAEVGSVAEPSEAPRSRKRKNDENKGSPRKLKETSLPLLSMLGTDSLSEHYHLELPSIESVRESVGRYKAFDFNLKEVRKSPRPQRLQPLRDHNGDVMSK